MSKAFEKSAFVVTVFRTSNSDVMSALAGSAKNWKPEFMSEFKPVDGTDVEVGDVVKVKGSQSTEFFVCGGGGEVAPLTEVNRGTFEVTHDFFVLNEVSRRTFEMTQ